MIGEAMVCCDSVGRRIAELESEREILVLAGEESLHPFVYEWRLRAIDEELERCRDDMDAWGAAIDEMAAWEAAEADSLTEGEEPDPFEETFDELCRIDGIDARELPGSVRTAEELMLADLRARREMLEM